MAKRIQSITTFTPTATADTTALVDATYVSIVQGGSATQRVNIIEVYQGGQAGASSPTFMLLSRDTTVAVTVSESVDGLGVGQGPGAGDAYCLFAIRPAVVCEMPYSRPRAASDTPPRLYRWAMADSS